MNLINNDIILKMNTLGKSGVPFFFMIDFEKNKPFVVPLSEIDTSILQFCFENQAVEDVNPGKFVQNFHFNRLEFSYEKYSVAFDKVIHHLNRGDTYLLNLTFPVKIEIDISLQQLYHLVKAKYKIWYKDQFLVFSPEIFVRIKNNMIFSYPMKGTIDASLPQAESALLSDKKELSEHYTIVDLIRNDLSIVSKNVRVNQFRYIDHLKTNQKHLLQTSSEISGVLDKKWKEKLGEIIYQLLPAGSVSGAPKKRTCEIIADSEEFDRGYYTGVAGMFNGESLDSCVMIRFIEQRDGAYFYRAGGGITTQSHCKTEYNELIDKVYVPVI